MNDMSRRTVLGTGFSLSLAAGLAAGSSSSMFGATRAAFGRVASSREPWIRKALKIGMITDGDTLLAKFESAKQAGFAGIELDSPGPYSADEVRAAIEATGITVPGVVLSTHWTKPFNHPDEAVRDEAAAALATAIEDCRSFGGTSVLVVPAVVNERMPYTDAYVHAQSAMRWASGAAADAGVTIAFENVWNNFLLSPIEAARFCDELNEGIESRVFGWHFDIGNVVNYGWPEQWIDTLGERIVKLDVKDFSRSKRDSEGLWKGFGVEIGDGDSGWERVRAALHRIGYRGWAAAEVSGGDGDRLREVAQRMDRVFDLV